MRKRMGYMLLQTSWKEGKPDLFSYDVARVQVRHGI